MLAKDSGMTGREKEVEVIEIKRLFSCVLNE